MEASPPASVVRLLGTLAVPARLAVGLAVLVEDAGERGSKTGLMTAVEIGLQAGARLREY